MKSKVLLIDDSVTIHRVIDLSIDLDRYDIVKVFSKEDAAIKVQSESFDYILLDNKLDNIVIVDYVAELKSAQPNASIILLVGAFDRFDENDLEKTGADDFLVKPFDSLSLNSKLTSEADMMNANFVERIAEADFARDNDDFVSPTLANNIHQANESFTEVISKEEYLQNLEEVQPEDLTDNGYVEDNQNTVVEDTAEIDTQEEIDLEQTDNPIEENSMDEIYSEAPVEDPIPEEESFDNLSLAETELENDIHTIDAAQEEEQNNIEEAIQPEEQIDENLNINDNMHSESVIDDDDDPNFAVEDKEIPSSIFNHEEDIALHKEDENETDELLEPAPINNIVEETAPEMENITEAEEEQTPIMEEPAIQEDSVEPLLEDNEPKPLFDDDGWLDDAPGMEKVETPVLDNIDIPEPAPQEEQPIDSIDNLPPVEDVVEEPIIEETAEEEPFIETTDTIMEENEVPFTAEENIQDMDMGEFTGDSIDTDIQDNTQADMVDDTNIQDMDMSEFTGDSIDTNIQDNTQADMVDDTNIQDMDMSEFTGDSIDTDMQDNTQADMVDDTNIQDMDMSEFTGDSIDADMQGNTQADMVEEVNNLPDGEIVINEPANVEDMASLEEGIAQINTEDAADIELDIVEDSANIPNIEDFASLEEDVAKLNEDIVPTMEEDLSENTDNEDITNVLSHIDDRANTPNIDDMASFEEDIAKLNEEELIEEQVLENQVLVEDKPIAEAGEEELTLEEGIAKINHEIALENQAREEEERRNGTYVEPVISHAEEETEENHDGDLTVTISRDELVSILGNAIDKHLLEEAVKEVIADSMKEIVKNIVPAIAEKYIKEEIERLKNDE